MKPLLLDLFCGAGGAAAGYARTGFDVVGVDVVPQPNYPYTFVNGDALDFVRSPASIAEEFDAVHASPPCQAFSLAQRIRGRGHADYIGLVRKALVESGVPYVIENVPGAPLRDPIELCGLMFPEELRTYRHRLFECSFPITAPLHAHHYVKQAKMGRPRGDDQWMQVVGNFSGAQEARDAMGIQWMTRDELREAIPPAYTEYIGQVLRRVIEDPPDGGWRSGAQGSRLLP